MGIDCEKGKVHFKRSPEGFPYIDLREHEEGVMMVNTVKENIEGFAKAQVKAAHKAYKLQGRTGATSDLDMNNLVRSTSLRNCPLTAASVSREKKPYLVLICKQ